MNIVLPPLHSAQREIVAAVARSRTTTVSAGRRLGKSLAALALAAREASEGRNVLWVAPVHRTASISWRRCKTLLAPLARAGVITFSESNMTLTWGRARIDFRGAESGDTLRGDGGYSFVVVDEAAHVPENVWFEIVRPMMLDAPGARVLLISTPRGIDDWFARSYRKGVEGAAGFTSLTFPSSANPHLDASEIENARQDMSPTAFAREIEARFCADDMVLFAALVRGTPPECNRRVLGCDLAISQKTSADHTALCVAGIAADNTTWILHAERGHWTMRETVARISATARAWGANTIAVERVAYQAAAIDELQRMPELRSFRVEGVVPKGDKVARAAPMSSRVASGAIRFADSLPEWFIAEVTGFPLARRDDGVDAMQLAYGAVASSASVESPFQSLGSIMSKGNMTSLGMVGGSGQSLGLLRGRR